ncbi:MAG: hypothetical protein KGL36_02620 [Gammaproteobacteria bacterium]|nr:hypothetical protein [Gammaproteobacteria bacterium]
MHTGESEHIDHFVPWSRYPRDLAHDLVLAAEAHLERWMRRNADHGNAIGVARWAYAHGQPLHARTWLRDDAVEPLNRAMADAVGGIVAC